MRSTIVFSLAVLLAAIESGPLCAQTAASKPEQHHYIIVLKAGKGADPDVTAFGGSVQNSQFGRMFVTLPEPAVDALRKHQRVKYIQRTLLPGEDVASSKPASAAQTNLAISAAAPQRLVPRPNGTGSWSTGAYAYDGAGSVTAIGTAATPNSDGKANSYVYDVLGRLKQGTANFAGGNVSQTYTYDRYGNVTEVDTTDPTGTYYNPITVAAGSNRLSSAQVTYDAAGNLTADGTNSAHFDSLNMMTSKSASGSLEYYIYNAEDERIGVQTAFTFWTWSIRDESGKILRQYQSIAVWPGADWLWLEDYAYREGALLAAERVPEEGGRRDFHLDHLGTPRLETGANGGLIARHDYLPFGKEITSIRQELDEGFDRIDPPHFTGHERDFMSVQSYSADYTDYMHARYYDTMELRFFSVDPVLNKNRAVAEPQRWNRYSYVANNPATRVDPDGREDPSEMAMMMGHTPNRESLNRVLRTPEGKVVAGLYTLPWLLAGGAEVGTVLRVAFTAFPRTFLALMSAAGGFVGMPEGSWVNTTETMSARAAAYQSQITGHAASESYLVNGVKFDGVTRSAFLEAKGPGYSSFIDKATGSFKSWWSGGKELLKQATRQVAAAQGAPIEWHVAEEAVAKAIRDLLEKNGITSIKVIWTVSR